MSTNNAKSFLSRRELLIRSIAGASGILSASVLGEAAAAVATTGRRGGTISMMSLQGPDSLIPQFYSTGYARFMFGMMFTALLRWTPELQLAGWLADKWEASADATTYTFHIRQDAVWNDGRPITAEDVAFTIRAIADPGYNGIDWDFVSQISGAAERRKDASKELTGVRIVDEKTVQLKTVKPYGALLSGLGAEMMILPKHVLGSIPSAEMKKSPFAFAPTVSSGAFKYVKYAADQYLEIEANDKYFLGKPNLDRIIIKILSGDVAVAQLERGELDMIPGYGSSAIPPIEVERVKKMPHIVVTTMPGEFLQYIVLNYRNPKFKDVRVRQAIAHSIDQKAILDKVVLGYGVLNPGPSNSNYPYYNDKVKGYPFDPARSKALLKEAGWDSATELVISYPPGSTREAMAPILQAYMTTAGFKVRLEVQQLPQLLSRIQKQPETYDMTLLGYRGYFDPDTFLYRRFHTKAIPNPNLQYYSNPKVDELLEKGQTLVNEKDRRPIYDEVQRIVMEDLPVIPQFVDSPVAGRNKRLVGPRQTVVRMTDNIHEWRLTE